MSIPLSVASKVISIFGLIYWFLAAMVPGDSFIRLASVIEATDIRKKNYFNPNFGFRSRTVQDKDR